MMGARFLLREAFGVRGIPPLLSGASKRGNAPHSKRFAPRYIGLRYNT